MVRPISVTKKIKQVQLLQNNTPKAGFMPAFIVDLCQFKSLQRNRNTKIKKKQLS